MTGHLGGRKLGRTGAHRRATLANMATSLLKHERVVTTVAKAKELRAFAERLITQAKRRRHDLVRRRLRDVGVYSKLFDVLVPRYQERPGGYTRLVRIGRRRGDSAERGLVRLVA